MDLDPTAPAVEFEGTWSQWGDLGASADAVEGVLGECGLGAGTPVGIMLRNPPAQLGALFGVLRAGACVVTVNPMLGVERLRDDVPRLELPVLLGSADDLARLPESLVSQHKDDPSDP